ncbi:DNA replication terminus site-binding protein [Tatumella sp. OPLPL6]|uniref:DNA replication terminus site-binding protein n=1 Tax=Tatumella sp. OPLPL6 TaxID=1928657 RepID=UPI000C177FA1|nr:DNA replication terminus site-binding protein [Tatumella sp. OPLPL6]PIJ46712.1 DNA replication terminus site-binding protein [Tatumella sp. OPLPL6]
MRYTLVEEMRETLALIETELATFCQNIESAQLLAARVFTLPPVAKGEELDPTPAIHVEQHIGRQARQRALQHFSHLYLQQQSEQQSTRSATRLPGVVCIKVSAQQQQRLMTSSTLINQTKQHFQQLITVESGLPPTARFPFVHQHFPGLLTLNVYRMLNVYPSLDSVNFGWANKHVIKRYSQQDVIEMLEKSLQAGRARAPWSREEWAEKVQEELQLIKQLPRDCRLKIKRPVKVQPIARLWQSHQQKQTQVACPNPLIITCLEGESIPELGSLQHYDEENITHRHKPDARSATLVIPRLWLWKED